MKRDRPLWALLAAVSLSLGTPASAARKNGVPVRSASPRSSSPISTAGTAPTCAAGHPCHMLYYGGKVIPNAKVYVVNWTSGVTAGGDLGGFYNAVVNSSYLDWLNEYDTDVTTTGGTTGVAGTQQFIGRGVYARTITISPSGANAGGTSACANSSSRNCCPAAAPAGFTCLFDDQIQAELNAQIAAGNLPEADENSLYMTYFPPHTFISDPGGSPSCQGGGFCGYHGTFKDATREFYYGVLPDHGPDSGGCDVGCGSGSSCGTEASCFANLTSTSGHELCEAITDPGVGLGTDADIGWYDPGDGANNQNGEVGDMCNSSSVVAGFTVQNIFSNVVASTDALHACVVSRVAASDFSVSISSNKKKVTGGTQVTVPITTATTGTDATPVTLALSFSGLPAHVTGALDHASVQSGSGAVLTLTADSGAIALNDVVVQVKAAAGTNIHTAAVLLDVAPASTTTNDYGLSITPPANGTTIAPGSSKNYTVNSSVIGTFTTPIALSIGALPTGVHGSFSPSAITPGQSSTLTLSVDSGTPNTPGTTFSVSGNAGGTVHGTSSIVAVNTAVSTDDFTIAITPPADTTLATGGSLDYTIDTTLVGNAQEIALTIGSLPTGVHAAFVDTTLTAGSSTTLTLSADPDAPNHAAASFTVTGTAASGSHTASSTVSVVGPNVFSLTLAPASGSIGVGGHATFNVTTAVVTGDSSEAISLSVNSLPAGVSGTMSPSVVHAGGGATLTLTADGTADPGGPFTFEVDGESLSDFEYALSDLTVAADDFSLSISPSANTVSPGGSKTYTVSAAQVSGAPAGIALTVSGGLPSGVTAAFSPATIQPGGSSTLTLAAASGAPAASAATFTVQGQDAIGVVRAATAQVSVSATAAGNDFGISLSPSPVTVSPGHAVTVAVNTTLASGVAESIAFAAGSLPSGVTAAFGPASVSAGGSSTLTLTAAASAPLVSGASYTVTGTAASASHSATGTVNVAAGPTVSITSPSNGATVSGAVEIDATATPGTGATLLKIDLLVDGAVVASPTSSPAQAFWQSTDASDGAHVLTARAVDSNGGSTISAAVNVTVHNAGTAPPGGGGGGGCSSRAAGISALLGLLVIRRRRRVT